MRVIKIPGVSVKDFLIDIPAVQATTKRRAAPKKDPEYSLVLQNNTDFVINRKTKTTDRTLAYLISQGLFYVRDNKTQKVEPLSLRNYKMFFAPVYDHQLSYLTEVKWWSHSPRRMESKAIKIIGDQSMQKMYQHGLYVESHQAANWKENFENNTKLFQYCYDVCNKSDVNRFEFENIMAFATKIEQKINFNNAKHFIDSVGESSIRFSLGTVYYRDDQKNLIGAIDTYNLDFSRCIEYLLFDLYTQGILILNTAVLNDYIDYLRMQNNMYGKIKDKYPAYLKTEHDIMALKISTYEKHKKDLLVFNNSDLFKNLEYKKGDYCILLPKTSADIVDEGVNQSHCVASYVDKVARGETLIVFLRNKETPDKSLVTIEVKDDGITQARGFANRGVNEEEDKFITEWAKEKSLAYK